MIFKVKDGQVAAMSENLEEAQVLLKLSKEKKETVVDKLPTLGKRRGRKTKYATEEERQKAKRRMNRRWYERKKARLALEAAGTPVHITKVEG